MFNLLFIIILWETLINSTVSAGPTTTSNFQHNQDVGTSLMSIEERLQNLEKGLMQYGTVIVGKIDYYGRKIDNIENTLSRFKTYMQIELDKISENINSKNFKDDIMKDRTARKIDIVYERINHKLGNLEGQIDLVNVKSQNIKEIITNKLEKIEENLAVRDADIEAELMDTITAIDDLKLTCAIMEENITNATQESAEVLLINTKTTLKKFHTETRNALNVTNTTLLANILNLQNNIKELINLSNNTASTIEIAKNEVDENMNAYANKFVDMYWDLWKTTESVDDQIQILSRQMNLTRNEQQNSFRALTVQVGRVMGKSNISNGCSIENEKLEELTKKIDSNFENIILSQNLFLESCHRVQMDEAQLESEISLVLDKLIDIFESKTSVEPKDIENLASILQKHDENVKRNNYHIANSLTQILRKTTNFRNEILDNFNNNKLKLESIHTLLEDNINSTDSEIIHILLNTLLTKQQQIVETKKMVENSTSLCNTAEGTIDIQSTTEQDVWNLIDEIFHPAITVTATKIQPNMSECLPKYVDLIDVRSQAGKSNCSTIVIDTDKDIQKTNNTFTNNCLPNYADQFEVKSNSDNFTQSNCKNDQSNKTLPTYIQIIDLKSGINSTELTNSTADNIVLIKELDHANSSKRNTSDINGRQKDVEGIYDSQYETGETSIQANKNEEILIMYEKLLDTTKDGNQNLKSFSTEKSKSDILTEENEIRNTNLEFQ